MIKKNKLFIASFVKNDKTGGAIGIDYILNSIGQERIFWFNLKANYNDPIDCYSITSKRDLNLVLNRLFYKVNGIFKRLVFTRKFNRSFQICFILIYKIYVFIYIKYISNLLNTEIIKDLYISLDNDFVFEIQQIIKNIKYDNLYCIVSDDPAGALKMYGNSDNLISEVDSIVEKVLKKSTKIFTISEGMRLYYKKKFNLDSIVTYPVNFTKIRNQNFKMPLSQNNDILKIVHIGHLRKSEIVNTNNFISFLIESKIKFQFQFIGRNSSYYDEIFHTQNITYLNWVEQEELEKILDNSDFGYLPYSFNFNDTVFVKTSFPNKLTSYSKRGLPTIFHGPCYSDVCNFILNHGIGHSIDTIDPSVSFSEKITFASISKENVLMVAKRFFVPEEITKLYIF
jgi:hypothetical protein